MSDPHGKLTTAEIVRQMTGGESRIPPMIQDMNAVTLREIANAPAVPVDPQQPIRAPLLLPSLIVMAPTPLEIAIAELMLIETKLRQYADEQGTIAILRRAEDVAIVRKALEAL